MEDYQQCLECSELALNEALQQLNSASNNNSPPSKEEWVSTIGKLLEGTEVCFTKESKLLSKVPQFSSMARLANNLIQVRRELKSALVYIKQQLKGQFIEYCQTCMFSSVCCNSKVAVGKYPL